ADAGLAPRLRIGGTKDLVGNGVAGKCTRQIDARLEHRNRAEQAVRRTCYAMIDIDPAQLAASRLQAFQRMHRGVLAFAYELSARLAGQEPGHAAVREGDDERHRQRAREQEQRKDATTDRAAQERAVNAQHAAPQKSLASPMYAPPSARITS